MHPLTPLTPPPSTAQPGLKDRQLWAAAQELEATFLAEMLKAASLGEHQGEFGGGAGEEQFSSFMRLEQARAMVAGGGIGLAQNLFETLKQRETNAR